MAAGDVSFRDDCHGERGWVCTFFGGQAHVHTALAKVKTFAVQARDECLGHMLDALLGRDVDGEPRLALVVLLVHETLLALVESEEDYLGNIQRRVVLRNDFLF
jgi:hypothetical protein